MSDADKKSLSEWRAFVEGLSLEDLVDEARKANSAAFMLALRERGYSAQEAHACLELFARRFVALGQIPPAGGYVDLEWLARKP